MRFLNVAGLILGSAVAAAAAPSIGGVVSAAAWAPPSLPNSGMAQGAGTLTVTYQGKSSSIAIEVVAANVGTFTLNEGGTGPGVFTDAKTFKPITMVNPAHPGEALTLWVLALAP